MNFDDRINYSPMGLGIGLGVSFGSAGSAEVADGDVMSYLDDTPMSYLDATSMSYIGSA